MDFKNITENASKYLDKNSPTILVAAGIGGFIASVIITAIEAPKAKEHLEEVKKEKETLTTVDKVKTVAPHYIAPALLTIGSTACIVGSYSINMRRLAAITTTAALTEARFNNYRETIIENIGERKEKRLKEESVTKEVEKNPPKEAEIIRTRYGDNYLCYDSYSGRYFYLTVDKLKKVENELNKRLLTEMFIPINELYYELDLPGIKAGEDAGWDIDDGLIDFTYPTTMAKLDDGREVPCCILDFEWSTKFT